MDVRAIGEIFPTLIAIAAVAILAWSAWLLLTDWQRSRDREEGTAELPTVREDTNGQVRGTASFSAAPSMEVVIEVTNQAGKTVAVPLRPDDEQSIRSFLRAAETVSGGNSSPSSGRSNSVSAAG